MEASEHKSRVRDAVRAVRQGLTPEARVAATADVTARVLALPESDGVRAVLGYAAMPEELDCAGVLDALRERGARVALPRVCGPGMLALHWVTPEDTLVDGHAGIKEPPVSCGWAGVDDFDLVLVPGVAFDAECRRLGFGGGFYDTLLADIPSGATRVALAYDEQIVERVPVEVHDAPVDVVVTPTRLLRRSGAPDL